MGRFGRESLSPASDLGATSDALPDAVGPVRRYLSVAASTTIRTRFTVTAGARQSELFSVRERKNGDLVISTMRPDELAFDRAEACMELKEFRISVHGGAFPDATILHHNLLVDREHMKVATVLAPKRGQLIFPLYTYACPDLSIDRYASDARDHDDIVAIDHYDPRYGAIVYCLIISSIGTDVSGYSEFNCKWVDFRKFRVSVLWTYMRVPSFHRGSLGVFVGAQTPADYRSAGWIRLGSRTSPTRPTLGDVLRSSLNEVSNAHVRRLEQIYSEFRGAVDPEFYSLAKRYSREPILIED